MLAAPERTRRRTVGLKKCVRETSSHVCYEGQTYKLNVIPISRKTLRLIFSEKLKCKFISRCINHLSFYSIQIPDNREINILHTEVFLTTKEPR